MESGVSFELQGLDSLIAKLSEVTSDMRYRGGRSALRRAANLVRDEAIKSAERIDDPKTAKDISKNIAVRWNGGRYRRSGDLAFQIGVRRGRRAPGGDTFYWYFVEAGTERSKAQPFLRPALYENVDLVTNTFINEYTKSIDRAIRRAERQRSRQAR